MHCSCTTSSFEALTHNKALKVYIQRKSEASQTLFICEDGTANEEAIVPIHNHAIYYDDRYVITKQEKAHVLETFFESLNPLKLKNFSPKEKNKVVILTKIAEQFELGRSYSEKEVNQILKPVYVDYITIRRYLIMYGFIERTKDGSSYWLTV